MSKKPRVIGKTSDGVKILAPVSKKGSITIAQARAAVRKYLASLKHG